MREQDKQMYRDMPARVFIRAVRDPEMGGEEHELSEGEATDLLLLRELDAAMRGKAFVGGKIVAALKIARAAIASAPADAFGFGEQTLHGTPYSIRDELVANLDEVMREHHEASTAQAASYSAQDRDGKENA